MQSNFAACNAETRKWEGGDVNHPSDPGGLTSRGVTAARGAAYRKKMGMAPKKVTAWTNAQVTAFYRSEFWNLMGCDDLPVGVDLSTYDGGVNSGPARGLKWSKAALDVDTLSWIKGINKRRLGFVQGLKTWKVFGKGWARRIAGIEAKSFSMWLAWSKVPAPEQVLEAEASISKEDASYQGKVQKAAPGGGVAGAGADTLISGDVNWWLIGGIGFVTLAIVVILAIKIMQNNERAAAFKAEAATIKAGV